MSWVGPTSLEHTTSPPFFTLHAPPCHPGSPQASAVFPGTLTAPCFFRVDVAHLVLYHLSVCCKKKYFDFDREILPFTSENWDSLLLGEVRARKLGVHTGAHGEMESGREGSVFPSPYCPSLSSALRHPKGRTIFEAPLRSQQPQRPVSRKERDKALEIRLGSLGGRGPSNLGDRL